MSASNQWEVVSKSRKQKNLEKKLSAHTEQKRIAAQLPKLEELLPAQQYMNLFGNSNNGSNNNINKASPTKSTSSNASGSGKSKTAKTTTAAPADAAKKQSKSTSTAKPKTLEQAIKKITPDDFMAQLAQIKISCPGSELRWLSSMASYLNGIICLDSDPTFSGRSAQYPCNLASPALKQAILEFLRSVGETNLEYFFYSLLDSMATELNAGQHVAGYKFVLQLIGQHWPNICSRNMAKTAMLRNSYQNRSNICLSILWAIGQGGHQSLTEGVKVWQNLMLPNLELKNFSKFVVEYIERVLNAAITLNRKSDTLLINQQEFFACFYSLNATYNNFPKELQSSLKRSANLLLQRYIASPVKHANIFLTLLRDLNSNQKQRTEVDGCVSCLLSSGADDCFKVWRMNYKKQQLPSLLLLQAIDDNWTESTKTLAESQSYHAFLYDIHNLNVELQASKRKETYIDDLQAVLKASIHITFFTLLYVALRAPPLTLRTGHTPSSCLCERNL
ncbi:GH11685 [Drosophila grimshawi]|uniref:GH11685 n=1 Tax=Drosophila grimshawi TaxID=7222 RepID=B4JCR8_DROGR|nr:GH11685 [Drosophila grimshawi]